MKDGIVARGLKKVRNLLREHSATGGLSERQAAQLLVQLQDCAAALGGEASARQRATRLAQTYLALDDEGRTAFLRLIATGFGPDPQAVEKAHAQYQAALNSDAQWTAESALRCALRSVRLRILAQFDTLPQGVKFLVDLRSDLLRLQAKDPALRGLDRELEAHLGTWFNVGFLELERITWNSPAVLLEKLIEYEAVHAIRSWSDLKNRLDSDRRCYAFFHPRMPMEPLIFVEVALVDELADNVQHLLDEKAPLLDATQAKTAIFYSISSTQTGLRGVSFGNFLLKRVVEDLQRDFPRLTTFSTLSPIPTLRRWADKNPEVWGQVFTSEMVERVARHAATAGFSVSNAQDIQILLTDAAWATHPSLARALQTGLARLAARYLLQAKSAQDRPYDPVARFHLGNGARIERINPLADTSPNGLQQSYGMMVNYLYDPASIESNVEAFSRNGVVAASGVVRRAARD